MKKSDRIKKEAANTLLKIQAIARHIRNVEDNCLLLGTEIINHGEIEMGHKLIANGYAHDLSKFYGIEFEYLSINNPLEENSKLKLKMAVYHHQITNPHHIQYWPKGIQEMPIIYLAELVCDIKARSEEFGTDVREYVKNKGIQLWNISENDMVYKKIMEFLDILCKPPFEKIN